MDEETKSELNKNIGVVFVDVGSENLPTEYVQEIAKPAPVKTKRLTGKVVAIVQHACSSVAEVSTADGKILSVVIPAGLEAPPIGIKVPVEIVHNVARIPFQEAD